MSQQKYTWLLALSMVSLRQRLENDDPDDPFPSEMAEVTALVGRLRQAERQAANDMAAVMFILLLLLWWNCAKHRANYAVFYSGIRKINEAPFFRALPRIPHQMAAAWLLASSLSCDKSITTPQGEGWRSPQCLS